MSEAKSPITYKIILAGNHQTGKTLFIRCLANKALGSTQTTPTIAADLVIHHFDVDGVEYKLQIWDTAGQEAYHSITASYFRSCHGVFLVFDQTDRPSFTSLDYWITLISEKSSEMPIVVVIGNKNDLTNNIQVNYEEINQFCKNKGLTYFPASAVTGENVHEAALFMVRKLTENKRLKPYMETVQPVPSRRVLCC